MYTSTGADQQYRWTVPGAPSAATGTVLIPRAPWRGPGPRPVVTFAVGTQGQGHDCAASMQFDNDTEYEIGSAQLLLAAGYAVTITDYAGYTTGTRHPYVAGQVLGHNVLDIVRAARAIPGSGITTNSPVAIWGYSEGGSAASWAGELANSYTPDLKLVGVAAGGVPSHLPHHAEYLDGTYDVDLLLIAMRGLSTAYPNAGIMDLLNARGLEAVQSDDEKCLAPMLTAHSFSHMATFLKGGRTLAQAMAVPSVYRAVDANTLGTHPINAPVYLYWSNGDMTPPTAVSGG